MKHIQKVLFSLMTVVVFCITSSQSKIFTRCGLRDELIHKKFVKSFIPQWVCLIDAESGYNTSKIGIGPNGSKKYGIFQINSKKYCKEGSAGGLCNMKCEDLLNDDISDDSKCAQLAQQLDGFRAWSGWVRVCKGVSVDIYLAHCPPTQRLRY